MIRGSSITVVVPAFEEERHVGRVVATMPSFVDAVIVVDDGSRDATARVAAREGARVLVHAKRRGVGAAIATGYREALERDGRDEDVIAVMAGDGQMHPSDLATVVAPVVRGEADYVKGNRFGADGVRRAMGLPRWIGGQVFSRLTSLAIGQRITDSQCGYTAISRRAALALHANGALDGLWPRFGYPNDLLGLIAARGLRIAEVPVLPIYGNEESKLRLRHLPPFFYLIARAAVRRRAGGGVRDVGVTRMGDEEQKPLRATSAVSS